MLFGECALHGAFFSKAVAECASMRSSVASGVKVESWKLNLKFAVLTCNLQPVTCNLQPATCNLQPATCNLQPINLRPAVPSSFVQLLQSAGVARSSGFPMYRCKVLGYPEKAAAAPAHLARQTIAH